MKSDKLIPGSALAGKVIAVPESRQLDVLSDLFLRRGAEVVRIPLISILDAPDQALVMSWIDDFIKTPPDYFVILTGEGLRRLCGAADRGQVLQPFISALAQTCKICRGPKPDRVLKELGLSSDLRGTAPTSAGIISTLESLQLGGKRLAVQLYGQDPNIALMDFVKAQALTGYSVVAPYIYASESDTELVKSLILNLANGQIDMIAFTSQPQVRRLFDVAARFRLLDELHAGLAQTKIAAIGPVVANVLKAYGCQVDSMPVKSFFMKPLVTAAEQLFAAH